MVEKNEMQFSCADLGVFWSANHLQPMPSHTCNFKAIPFLTPEKFCIFLLSLPSSLCWFSGAAVEGGSELLHDFIIALGDQSKGYLLILAYFIAVFFYWTIDLPIWLSIESHYQAAKWLFKKVLVVDVEKSNKC